MGSIPSVSGMGKGLYTDQLKKLQTLYPDIKILNYKTLAEHTNPNLFGQSLCENNKDKKDDNYEEAEISTNKLFKRSAFHVAIAYHIYLKNLKLNGK